MFIFRNRILITLSIVVVMLSACDFAEGLGRSIQDESISSILDPVDYHQLKRDYFTRIGFDCPAESSTCSRVNIIPQKNPGDISNMLEFYEFDSQEYKYSLLIVTGYANLYETKEINLKTGIVTYQSAYVDLFNGERNVGTGVKNLNTGEFAHEIDITSRLTPTHSRISLEDRTNEIVNFMQRMTLEVYGLNIRDYRNSRFIN